jgi:hypothetical protein
MRGLTPEGRSVLQAQRGGRGRGQHFPHKVDSWLDFDYYSRCILSVSRICGDPLRDGARNTCDSHRRTPAYRESRPIWVIRSATGREYAGGGDNQFAAGIRDGRPLYRYGTCGGTLYTNCSGPNCSGKPPSVTPTFGPALTHRATTSSWTRLQTLRIRLPRT